MTAARQALVIGNGGYGGSLRLNCPTNDATLVKRSLTDLGFEVTFGPTLVLTRCRLSSTNSWAL